MDEAKRSAYRVTIRYYRGIQQYEVVELDATDVRDAMSQAVERFPAGVLESADLVEIRLANPSK